jgi:hypothetical protein
MVPQPAMAATQVGEQSLDLDFDAEAEAHYRRGISSPTIYQQAR